MNALLKPSPTQTTANSATITEIELSRKCDRKASSIKLSREGDGVSSKMHDSELAIGIDEKRLTVSKQSLSRQLNNCWIKMNKNHAIIEYNDWQLDADVGMDPDAEEEVEYNILVGA